MALSSTHPSLARIAEKGTRSTLALGSCSVRLGQHRPGVRKESSSAFPCSPDLQKAQGNKSQFVPCSSCPVTGLNPDSYCIRRRQTLHTTEDFHDDGNACFTSYCSRKALGACDM